MTVKQDQWQNVKIDKQLFTHVLVATGVQETDVNTISRGTRDTPALLQVLNNRTGAQGSCGHVLVLISVQKTETLYYSAKETQYIKLEIWAKERALDHA